MMNDYCKQFLADRKVLVLGGAGFVGSAAAHELVDIGCRVYVFDNLLHGVKSNVPEGATFVPGDILDGWSLLHSLKEFTPEYVINFVGDTYIPTSYHAPKRFIDINIQGAYNVLRACTESQVRKLIHISTAEVYGDRDEPLTENTEIQFVNTYAVTKIAGDGLCQTFATEHGTPVCVARLFNCYGPRPAEPYVISDIVRQLCLGNEVNLGNIHAVRDFTYVHDSARAIISLLAADTLPGCVVNVGSGQSYSIQDIFTILSKIMDRPESICRIDPCRFRKKDINSIRCNNSRLVSLTGWKPSVGIHEGLQMTVDWFIDNGKRWSWEDYVSNGRALK